MKDYFLIGLLIARINEIKYFSGFDGNFTYMANENNDVMKTIGKHYDILQIINIEVVKDINNINRIAISIFFVMNNDADNYVIKLKNCIPRNQMIKAFEIEKK